MPDNNGKRAEILNASVQPFSHSQGTLISLVSTEVTNETKNCQTVLMISH